MSRKFYIQYEDTCPQCHGRKVMPDPLRLKFEEYLRQWDRENPLPEGAGESEKQRHKELRWQAERTRWLEVYNVHVLDVARDFPRHEIPCTECDGTGIVRGRTHLKVALRALGYRPEE